MVTSKANTHRSSGHDSTVMYQTAVRIFLLRLCSRLGAVLGLIGWQGVCCVGFFRSGNLMTLVIVSNASLMFGVGTDDGAIFSAYFCNHLIIVYMH